MYVCVCDVCVCVLVCDVCVCVWCVWATPLQELAGGEQRRRGGRVAGWRVEPGSSDPERLARRQLRPTLSCSTAPRPAVARAIIDCPCRYAQSVAGLDCDGGHDEASCNKRGGDRNAAHDAVAEMLAAVLLTAGIGRTTLRNWDRSGGSPTTRRIPDIICTPPTWNVTYVIDVRIVWTFYINNRRR